MAGEQWIQKAREILKEIIAVDKAMKNRVYRQSLVSLTQLLRDATKLYFRPWSNSYRYTNRIRLNSKLTSLGTVYLGLIN